MTTINNLSIEQMREIVEGAPESAFAYNTIDEEFMFCGDIQDGYSTDDCEGCFDLNDLRTAIAKHDEFKVGDLVVCTNRGFNEVDKIREFDSDGYFTTINGYYCNPRVFRHATIDEIKDGHRIDDTTEQTITKLCIGCGSPDLHKGGEIKEPKMCLDCFAEMVGFTRTSNGFVESDEVTDIRNHVSPSTRVVDL